MKPPAPPRVEDVMFYWSYPPPEPSARCIWWLLRIHSGWIGNKRTRCLGYHPAAEYFGVFIWEYLYVLSPELRCAAIRNVLDRTLS